MLLSMTAFGKAKVARREAALTMEIHSVNRKVLDLKVSLPSELRRFEPEVQRLLSPMLSRGAVSVRIEAEWLSEMPFTVTPNLPLVKQYVAAGEAIAEACGFDKREFTERLLLSERDLLRHVEPKENSWILSLLEELVSEAMKPFLEMKRYEGEKLYSDIKARLDQISEHLPVIEKRAPEALKRYEERLKERVRELLPESILKEELLIKEIALFGERTDIAEEITRLNLHIKHFKEKAEQGTNPGKTLEFLLQEMLREANTIASKVQDAAIQHIVVDIKSKIEQIKEQVQNVE